jgi:tetratricopeptide (TPR) repeat protein
MREPTDAPRAAMKFAALKFATLGAALLAGCASGPAPSPTPSPSSTPVPETGTRPAQSENVAIAGLMQNARTDVAAGRLSNAAATLERALRIEPRNPRLWRELALVRLKQGEYVQAESVAARSNSWAGTDNTLRAENWRLIAQAREARGDADGARTALDTAAKIGR